MESNKLSKSQKRRARAAKRLLGFPAENKIAETVQTSTMTARGANAICETCGYAGCAGECYWQYSCGYCQRLDCKEPCPKRLEAQPVNETEYHAMAVKFTMDTKQEDEPFTGKDSFAKVSSREGRMQVAQETQEILTKGFYTDPNRGQTVDLRTAIAQAQQQSIVYLQGGTLTPPTEDTQDKKKAVTDSNAQTTFEVSQETTLQACFRLTTQKDRGTNNKEKEDGAKPTVLALNFASAKHPGLFFISHGWVLLLSCTYFVSHCMFLSLVLLLLYILHLVSLFLLERIISCFSVLLVSLSSQGVDFYQVPKPKRNHLPGPLHCMPAWLRTSVRLSTKTIARKNRAASICITSSIRLMFQCFVMLPSSSFRSPSACPLSVLLL